MAKREFTVANEYVYDQRGPIRWIISHVLRYKRFIVSFMLASIVTNMLYATVPTLTGTAFNVVVQGQAVRDRSGRAGRTVCKFVREKPDVS